MLSFFYMHKSGYLIKFAFPVSKILSCPQNPFQSSKSLNFMQNDSMSKCGKAVFRRENFMCDFKKVLVPFWPLM